MSCAPPQWLGKIIARYYKLFRILAWLFVLSAPLYVYIGGRKMFVLVILVSCIGLFSALGGLAIQTDVKKYQALIKKYNKE